MNLLNLSLLLFAILCDSRAKRITLETQEGSIAEDIISDPDSQTLLVTVGDVSKIKHFVSTTNLHDLRTGWVAIKGIDVETCLLKPSERKQRPDRSSPYGKNVRTTAVTLYWKIKPDILSYEEIEEFAGQALAEFCAGYKTQVLIPNTAPVMSRMIDRSVGSLRRQYKRDCSWCIGCCNGFDALDIDEIDRVEV